MLCVRALRARRGLGELVGAAAGLLRVLALDVDSRHTRGIPLAVYAFTAVTIGLYLYVYHVSIYWMIGTVGRDDALLCVILFSLAASSLIGVVKLLYMYLNSKKLRELVSEYLQCDAAVAAESRMAQHLLTTLGLVQRRAIVFWSLIIGNGVVYLLRPLLTPGKHLMEDQQVLLGLEPMFDSPNYEIAMIIWCFGVFCTVYPPASITAFVIIIVGYTEAQLLALAQELLHLWDDAQRHYQKTARHSAVELDLLDTEVTSNMVKAFHTNDTAKNIIINDYIRHQLGSIMKLHAINKSLIKKVEGLFQSAIAMEFALLSAGLIAELLGGLENTYIEMPFALVQVSMDCITGQKLMDANKAFEEAVYGCRWEDFDVRNMKLVIVMLRNSQQTMTLSAGGVVSLSYFSLMSIFRSIYSAYTGLRSTMNK